MTGREEAVSRAAIAGQLEQAIVAARALPTAPSVLVGDTPNGPLVADVGRLLKTRLLVQAASGGGKSWLLRRLLQQTHAMVQQIVVDPEGELVTLAEHFDYIV